MKLTELLEEDKEALLRAMRGAGDAEKAAECAGRELERMLFAFNDAAPSPRLRESAAGMVGALRSALPLMDCAGEVKVWEHREKEKGLRLGTLPLILLIAGWALCLAAAGLLLSKMDRAALCLLPLAGGLLLSLAGARIGRDRSGGAPEYRTETSTDWDKVYRTLHTAALVMDQTLEEAASAERWEQRRVSADQPALSPEETELMAALLEAAYSGDGEYALDTLQKVRHYLRAKGVEAVDCTQDTAPYFDRMPGNRSVTLCPALLQGGTVLRRGMATVPER